MHVFTYSVVMIIFFKVMLYNGQLDVIIPVVATEKFLRTVPWQYLDEYRVSTKK